MSIAQNSTLDALAASYLHADIAEAKAQLDVIGKEIEKLQAKRRAVEWKIGMLSGASSPAVSAPANGSGSSLGDANVPAGIAESNSQPGFRERIREVLRHSSKGLKTGEIAAALLATGFQYTAKTKINVRVNSDLRRLVKSGSVQCKRGLYTLNAEQNQ